MSDPHAGVPSTVNPHPDDPLAGELQGADPQTRVSPEPERDAPPVSVGRPTPTPEEINAYRGDARQGDAVGAQPTGTDPADRQDARERSTWDADTPG